MMDVLGWDNGQFEFNACPVAGDDEVGVPTTHLLLEHARVADESGSIRRSK